MKETTKKYVTCLTILSLILFAFFLYANVIVAQILGLMIDAAQVVES